MSDRFQNLFKVGDWIVEKIVTLRGKPYNRIAIFVVSTGLLLCAEPFWEPYLEAFFEKHFSIQIPTKGAPWVGLILVFFGLSYHYLREKSQRGELSFTDTHVRRHDASCYSGLVKEFSFLTVRQSIDWIATNHAFFGYHKEPIRHHALLLNDAENKFLDEEVAAAASEYLETLVALNSFLTTHFFTYPDFRYDSEGFQFCLYPNWNPDRAGSGNLEDDSKYARKADELDSILTKAFDRQADFIDCLKRSLGADFFR